LNFCEHVKDDVTTYKVTELHPEVHPE